MNQTIVITGCSSGFGYDLALKLARRGDRVYATMRAPDGVVNNAGQMFGGITEAFTADELARQLDVNVVGVHRVLRAFVPAMREAGRGLVMNVSSTAGRCALPFFGVYHASKWALEGYTQALRLELAASGVDAVIVEPCPFTTNLFPAMTAPTDADGRAATYPAAVTGPGTFAGTFEALRRTRPEAERPYRVWGYPVVPALYLLAVGFLLVNTLVATPGRAVAGLGLIALGLPVYAYYARRLPPDDPEDWLGEADDLAPEVGAPEPPSSTVETPKEAVV